MICCYWFAWNSPPLWDFHSLQPGLQEDWWYWWPRMQQRRRRGRFLQSQWMLCKKPSYAMARRSRCSARLACAAPHDEDGQASVSPFSLSRAKSSNIISSPSASLQFLNFYCLKVGRILEFFHSLQFWISWSSEKI